MDGLQIDLVEADQQVVNVISPQVEKKTPHRRLIQSTLLPYGSQANRVENNNEEEENKVDLEYVDSINKSKRKRNGKGSSKCTPVKTPINSQESLSVKMENENSLLTKGLQIDLMERLSEEDKQVANAISPHFEMKTPSRRLVQSTLLPHRPQINGTENNNAEGKAEEDEIKEKVASGLLQHSEKRTPRTRLIQATLLPHRSQENGEENINEVEEDNGEDDEYCGSQKKGKRKRKGKRKSKHSPSMNTPTSCQGALSGRTETKDSMHNNEMNLEGQNEADLPEGDDKSTKDLESGSCKRSTRQSKKGQRASPHKNLTPRKLKGQKDSPRKASTPNKLKGPHCRRIIAEDTQTGPAKELVFDLRLEEKNAAEENARLFKGRQTHPFFSSWKMGKKVQGTSEATELESRRCSMLHEGQPIHVFEALQDDSLPLDWSNWSFSDECALDSSCDPEFSGSSFYDSVKPLMLDNFLFTSDSLGASVLQNGISLDSSSDKMPFGDGRLSSLQVEDRHLDNSLDSELENRFLNGRIKLHYPDRGPENSLWTNKYQPRKASEVCGNTESVRFLNEWLGSWRERYSQNPKNFTRYNKRVTEDSDYGSKDSDSDAESMEESAELKNVLLISGPVGSGKSAAIYACAREQGFQVIEVSASDWRNGAHIKQKFGAAMESHGLNKWSSEEPLASRMKHLLESPSTQTSKPSFQELDGEFVEVFTETCKGESDSLKQDPIDAVVKDNLIASSKGADKTLILFEDVDTIFDEDRGLISSIHQIAETAKRPMILTSNRIDPVLPDQLDRLEVCFTIPSQEDLVSQLDMVCAAEQAAIHPEVLHRLIKCCQGDIRKTIMLLQFWCQGKINKRDRKVQSAHTPECFDLDAGHLIIPNIVPWEFPCQLSELVEKEITKSLAAMKENASLMCILEEEDLTCKETDDALVTNAEAKKEAMLSMNHSLHDGNEFSMQFDSLNDFSNSLGSPVASTRRPGRRGLCTVLSSDSEDTFHIDNVPSGSNVQSMDLCNGMFPDVSHQLLANTIAVQNYQDPAVAQLHTSGRETLMQTLGDCFPTKTDQQLCEAYKLEDIFHMDNVRSGLNVQPMDLFNGMFPDVSHRSLANTVAVQYYQDPPAAQLHTSGRETLMETPGKLEDIFHMDNVPSGSNVQPMDLCNGMFPDISHQSLANTNAVQNYQDPAVAQLRTSGRETLMQTPGDCFPTETDQQFCETYRSVDISCVPESSFVPETEINGVELPSNTVSWGHAAMCRETVPSSTAKSLESMSITDTSNLHEATRGLSNSENLVGTTCEIDAASVHSEEIGDSQNEHAESVSRRYQVMDECSRAGYSMASVFWENPRSNGQASSVPETWRRLRCCHGDLKSYITAEQRNASQIVKLASGLTDLISVSDLMFCRCQPLITDILETSRVPSTEPEASCWYDEHLAMASTITQHGFCFFAKKSVERGSSLGFSSRVDLASDMLASTTSITALGQLLAHNLNTSQNSFSKRDLEIKPSECDISLKRETEARFYAMIQNLVPSKMYLSLKGTAFHEYVSSLGQISKLEASRLSENIDKSKQRRRGRVARHYLSSGSHILSPEDVTLLAQNSSFGETALKLTFR